MKNTIPFTLHIPKPCSEKWNQMTPDEKGRFCHHCQKTVIDFSQMNDHEIANLMDRSKEQICGRLHVSQLNREMYITEQSTPWMKIAAVLSALTLTAPALSAKHTAIETIQQNEQANSIARGDTITVITGQVVDSTRNFEPLPGATIFLKGTKIGTTTDATGNFSLRLPHDISGKDILLTISFIGYETKSRMASLNAPETDMVIALVPQQFDEVSMVGIVGGIQVWKRPTAWQRFKNKVGAMFHK